MPRIAVHVNVADYDTWRPNFEKGSDQRAKFGVTNPSVYRNADRPNEIVVVSDVTDVAKAVAGIRGPEVREMMSKSGVQGEPQIFVAEPA
jgi:hypothetical protein